MKCKYRFHVHGLIRLQSVLPIRSKFYHWEFELAQGLLRNIVVTVQLKDQNAWPSIIQNPRLGVNADIRIRTDDLPFIQAELRTIQGLLSLWGVHSIDIRNPEIEWIAENEEERSALGMYYVKGSTSGPEPGSIPPMPFDLLARSVLAANTAHEMEIPLNFFRRGLIDVHDRQYIEAIYDFYFVLETLFADGAFKVRDVKKAFRNSSELCDAIKAALKNPLLSTIHELRLYQSLEAKLLKMTVPEYIEHLVELRGFLHHHSQRRKGIWSPERQDLYEADALLLESVTSNVLFCAVAGYLDHPEVLSMFRESIRRASDPSD